MNIRQGLGDALRGRALVAGAMALAATGSLAVTQGNPVQAATFVVTNTTNAGAGSLRAAVQSANGAPGQDTITFALPSPSVIDLTTDIRIMDDIRIEGPGETALTIRSTTTRVFDVDGASIFFSGMTLDGAGANAIIVNSPSKSVELDLMTISNSFNHALAVDGAQNITVRRSNLTNDQDPTSKGDGINAINVSGNVLIEDVVASGNEDNFQFEAVAGNLTLRRVTATGAFDEAADIQHVGGAVVIESSLFAENNDQIMVVDAANLSITDTAVSGTALDDGLEITDVGSAVIDRSTISGGAHGGVFASGPLVTTNLSIVNSTVSGNARSGIITRPGSTVTVRHSTVVDNGMSALNVSGGAATASHTIFFDNAGGTVDSGTATISNSLVPAGSGFTGAGNVATDDAKLGPLTDNGGPTQTHMLLDGSPAINAGDPAVASPPATDQRGQARLVGTIDIGSVEKPATPPPTNRGSVSIQPANVTVQESVGTIPFTITRSGGGDGAVSVKVSTLNVSAAAPGDFTALSQTVAFAAGEVGSKTVNVTIIDDSTPEATETFAVRLTEAEGGVSIGTSAATVTIVDNDTVQPPDPELDAAGRFVPLAPQRIFETREGEPGPGPKGKVPSGGTIDVQITGVAGIPANATAVVMNVTMTLSEGPGYVTVWPTGSQQPATSNLNYLTANATRPNLVTVPIGVGGKVSLFALNAVHLLGDVAGYYVDVDVPVDNGRFVPLTPARVFDTRENESAPGPKGIIRAGQTIDVKIAGEAGLPSTGISAVVLNLTATAPSGPGYITAYPTNVARPTASVLNMSSPTDTVANLVIVPLGADGNLRFYSLDETHLLGDVMGYFTAAGAPVAIDGLFVPLNPQRVFDSRPTETTPPGPKGFVGAKGTVVFKASGVQSIPADAGAVMFNITATESAGPNFVTGWPTGLKQPLASLLNLNTGDTRPNATILAPGTGGNVSLYTLAGAHLLADTFGYYLG